MIKCEFEYSHFKSLKFIQFIILCGSEYNVFKVQNFTRIISYIRVIIFLKFVKKIKIKLNEHNH